MFLVLGCAEADPDDTPPNTGDALISAPAGGDGDALTGMLGGDARGLPPLPDGGVLPPLPDSGRPPPDAMVPPQGCQPGMVLGLCSVCGADGLPTQPADDPNCPPVNCALAAIYEREEVEGATVCNRRNATPGASRCKAVGQCHDQPGEYCMPAGAATEVARIEGPCEVMEGCIGNTEPTVDQQPQGTPCEGGTCDAAGACVPDRSCDDFRGERAFSQFCEEGNDGFVDYCEFFLDAPGDERTTCANFCASQGTVCLDAWNDRDGDCRRGDDIECGQDLQSYVCRCERPR